MVRCFVSFHHVLIFCFLAVFLGPSYLQHEDCNPSSYHAPWRLSLHPSPQPQMRGSLPRLAKVFPRDGFDLAGESGIHKVLKIPRIVLNLHSLEPVLWNFCYLGTTSLVTQSLLFGSNCHSFDLVLLFYFGLLRSDSFID